MRRGGGGRPGSKNTRTSNGPDPSGWEAPKDTVEFEGVVVEQMRNASFRVELENGHIVLARVAGKMRRFRIRVMPGDKVRVAVSTYDPDMGRITFRYRS